MGEGAGWRGGTPRQHGRPNSRAPKGLGPDHSGVVREVLLGLRLHRPGGRSWHARREVAFSRGSAADNSLVDFGFNFSTLNRLNEHGLIISDYDSWSDFRFSVVRRSDEPPRPLLPFHHQGRQWVLVADATRHPGAEFRIKGPALTFAGQELSRVVEQEPIPNYTERLEAFFLGQKFRMVRLDDLATRTNSMTFEQ